jgi:hypothetical protein
VTDVDVDQIEDPIARIQALPYDEVDRLALRPTQVLAWRLMDLQARRSRWPYLVALRAAVIKRQADQPGDDWSPLLEYLAGVPLPDEM